MMHATRIFNALDLAAAATRRRQALTCRSRALRAAHKMAARRILLDLRRVRLHAGADGYTLP